MGTCVASKYVGFIPLISENENILLFDLLSIEKPSKGECNNDGCVLQVGGG